ncbi:unnamed protein product [Parnassius mnemosyne]|uniref:PiggyBac transposable element-derived protein domain-containing protein n=1 Tax=Parnassius mnemosyne TaxID=213953 RepID=A0AAV1KSU1_9NEOP
MKKCIFSWTKAVVLKLKTEEFSEQEGEIFQEPLPEILLQSPSSSLDIAPDYLDDVPVSSLQRGYYLGKDGMTKWAVTEPSQRVRTRSHNIVLEAPGPEPKGAARLCLNIVDAWNLIFLSEDLQLIVDCTNLYIDKRKKNYQRIRDCKHTDVTEIRALFGLLYFIGTLRGAHLNTEYLWASDGTGSDVCLVIISLSRFHFLLACIRFDNIHTRMERREHDKLTPIREVINNFLPE